MPPSRVKEDSDMIICIVMKFHSHAMCLHSFNQLLKIQDTIEIRGINFKFLPLFQNHQSYIHVYNTVVEHIQMHLFGIAHITI